MSILKRFKRFFQNEAGLEASEYVITAFLITLAVIAGFTNVASAIRDKILMLASYLN